MFELGVLGLFGAVAIGLVALSASESKRLRRQLTDLAGKLINARVEGTCVSGLLRERPVRVSYLGRQTWDRKTRVEVLTPAHSRFAVAYVRSEPHFAQAFAVDGLPAGVIDKGLKSRLKTWFRIVIRGKGDALHVIAPGFVAMPRLLDLVDLAVTFAEHLDSALGQNEPSPPASGEPYR